MSWYEQGVVTLTNGSKTVTAVGAAWLANVNAASALQLASGGKLLQIESITNDNALQLAKPYAGASASGVAYEIIPTQGLVPKLAKGVGDLLASIGVMKDEFEGGTLLDGAVMSADLNAVSRVPMAGFSAADTQGIFDNSLPLQSFVQLRVYTGRAVGIRITSAGIAGQFRRDLTDVATADDGGTVIVDGAGRRWFRVYEGKVEVRWFGAKGDGVTDDTLAFKAASAAVMNAARLTIGQSPLVSDYAPVLTLGRGTYCVKGDRIFGSQLADGQVTTKKSLFFEVEGNGAVIMWDIVSTDNRLFNYDYTVHAPRIRNLAIFPINSTKTIPIGGDVFYYNAFSTGGVSYADGSGGYYENVTVNIGKTDAFSTRPRCLFKSMGKNMSDQTLVINCAFRYFERAFYSENSESVNWTFFRTGLFGGGNGTVAVTYFEFVEMGDNFNVVNCAFSLYAGETMLRTRSKLNGGVFTQTAAFNFNFRDNRMELYGPAASTWMLSDMDFGSFNFSGTNLRLGSGANNVKTIASAHGMGNLNFDKITFNPVEFRFPILTTPSLTGNASSYGALLRNCDLLRASTEYKYTNGTTVYSLHDAMVLNDLTRRVKLDACTYSNGGAFLSFELTPLGAAAYSLEREVRSASFSTSGVALGITFVLPPYQTIKKISVSMQGVLPGSYNAFRVYIGDVSIGNFFDVVNPRADTIAKSAYLLFEGLAAVFALTQLHQSITVFALNAGAEAGGIASEINVDYAPLDPRVLGITTAASIVKVIRARPAAYGPTAARPALDLQITQEWTDTTLGKKIWWNGAVWKDAMGTTV